MPPSDIKTNWPDYPVPMPGMKGDGVVSSGSDPNVNTAGSSALQTPYDKPIVSAPGGEETPNSVSGLPLQPKPALADAEPSPAPLERRAILVR